MARCLLVGLALSAAGCLPPANGAKHVTLADLEKETSHLAFFRYSGCDTRLHYFITDEGARYCIDRAAWDMPAAFPADGRQELYVTMRRGRLVPPDPEVVRGRGQAYSSP